MIERLRQRAVYAAYRGAGTVLSSLPEPAASLLAAAAGTVLAKAKGADRAMRERHIARVLGSASPVAVPDPGVVRRWASRSFRSYARYWVEGARVASTAPEDLIRRLDLDWRYAALAGALDSDRGVLIALPHVGSWEWGGAFLASIGHPMTTVAERVEPEVLFQWFCEQRRGMGLEVLPLDDEASGRTLVRVLRSGGLVGLVCDRDIAGNGIEVDLFGERTKLPGGPATLALRTGAALFPVAVYQGPGEHHVAVVTSEIDTRRRGPLRADVERITQELASRFEWLIRRAPEQWHLYQPNWSSDVRVEGDLNG